MSAFAQGSNLASPAVRALFRRRLAEVGGLLFALAGIAVLLALATYDVSDPSLNTATARPASNLAGWPGAMVADVLLQGFGAAGALPGFALLAWAWRMAAHRGLGSFPMRIAALLAALPVVGGVLAAVPFPLVAQLAWPTPSGLGGAGGRVVAADALDAGTMFLGPFGGLIVWGLGALLALCLTLLALGLSRGEWRAAARATGTSMRQTRRAAGFCGRVTSRVAATSANMLRRINGNRPIAAAAASAPLPEVAAFTGAVRGMAPEAPRPAKAPRLSTLEAPPPPVTRPDVKISASPPKKPMVPKQESLKLEGNWRFPGVDLLTPAPHRSTLGAPSPEALQANARLLESVLSDYGVQGQIVEIRPGPVVTLYELEPAPGIRSARVIGLADDVARSLSVMAVRIATVSGRNVIGIEVPNAKRETVYLSELIASEEWTKQQGNGRLALALGKNIGGDPIIADLARMPHLLVAGTTGSGKSVGINAMILSLLFRMTPEQCRLILIDPKMLELSVYAGIPHLMAPVVTEPAKAVSALKWTVREMERRYRFMSQLSVRNIGGYNDRVTEARDKGEVITRRVQTGFDSETGKPIFEDQALALEALPFIVVIIDEMADLMMVAGKEIEAAVQRLAQMARAAGIHVVMATQRPSVDVITGTIKANFPTRISFQVISKFDSRTILGEQGSEQLLGQGDMLYMVGGGRITRVHGPFVSDKEVEDIVAFLREQGEPAYLDEVTEPPEDAEQMSISGISGASAGEKGLFDQAVDVVSREGKASTSFIQRHLQIGYNRAAKLIEQMEKEGIVGPANHVGKREVLVRRRSDEDE